MAGVSETFRGNAVLAGVLFITATTATVISQVLMDPLLSQADPVAAIRAASGVFAAAVGLELVNALASLGIAVALFAVLRRHNLTAAVGYLGLRAVEGATGVLAAAGFLTVLAPDTDGAWGMALHDAGFLIVLIVFSASTLVLYPSMFRFRLVPGWLSLWGMAGGVLLLLSCLMILAGRIGIGSTPDMILSLPIAVNELVLALWLILRGVATATA